MKLLLCLSLLLMDPADDSTDLHIFFWNLENFFDWHDDGTGTSDSEFSSFGLRRWTRRRFTAKCHSIAKAIFSAASEKGSMPDVLAFAEVENRGVLNKLLELTPLRRHGYEIVHCDSPDPRGIDVALLYRKDRLKAVSFRPCGISQFPTRDILLVQFTDARGDSLAVLVNHHPSKYGGAVSEGRRVAAVQRMDALADSIVREGWERIVSVGDFNDVPTSGLYAPLERLWTCLSLPLAEKGAGSIRFEGRWQLIDLCFVTHPLAGSARQEVCALPCLTVRDSGHPGQKPFRTYSGPRYIGGVSDHYPIMVTVSRK